MANFNEALLTKKGIALLAKTQAGQTGVKLTKAAAGCGTYEEGESLVEREALKDQRQVFPLDKLSVQNSTTVSIRFTITNEQETGNLQEGYYVKEVGIFAEDPDEGEILYAIATTVTDQWDYMPAYNSLLPAYITVEFYVEVSNAASVTMEFDVTKIKAGDTFSIDGQTFEFTDGDRTTKAEYMAIDLSSLGISGGIPAYQKEAVMNKINT